MPRTARASVGGCCYHALNRGNGRAEVFHHEGDYHACVRLLRAACARLSMRLLGYCLMPNHFHLVLWPHGDGDLSDWMGWLLTAHVRRYQKYYRSSGHVWQGRFKAFPIAQDDHLRTVLRYAERHALRAHLVGRAEAWPWCSLGERLAQPLLPLLTDGPVALGRDWVEHVNAPQTAGELDRVRRSVARGVPFGGEAWVRQTAASLDLESRLRERGRPRGAAPRSVQTAGPTLFPEELSRCPRTLPTDMTGFDEQDVKKVTSKLHEGSRHIQLIHLPTGLSVEDIWSVGPLYETVNRLMEQLRLKVITNRYDSA